MKEHAKNIQLRMHLKLSYQPYTNKSPDQQQYIAKLSNVSVHLLIRLVNKINNMPATYM